MMFGRKKKAAGEESTEPRESTTETVAESAPDTSADGPRDLADVSDPGRLIDLGAVHAMPGPGMELRLEVDQQSQEVTAIQIGHDEGSVQLQVFAAPRSSGIWGEIREEIAEMIRGNGGTAEETPGTFGTELRTRLAQPGPQGRTIFAPVIFAGIDGRRWFLRAVYSGSPALDEEARAPFDEVLRSLVIARGDEPRAPREMLPLQMPATSGDGPRELDEDGVPAAADLQPFERGPEITETR